MEKHSPLRPRDSTAKTWNMISFDLKPNETFFTTSEKRTLLSHMDFNPCQKKHYNLTTKLKLVQIQRLQHPVLRFTPFKLQLQTPAQDRSHNTSVKLLPASWSLGPEEKSRQQFEAFLAATGHHRFPAVRSKILQYL